jgi:hypothetical protein
MKTRISSVFKGERTNMKTVKNKYTDNKLAEEFDLIVLLNDTHRAVGIRRGALGTLTRSYTGGSQPLYATFETDEHMQEMAVGLDDFRVLDVKTPRDLSLITAYLKSKMQKGKR